MQQNMAMDTNNYPKSVNETMNIPSTFAKMNNGVNGKKPFQRNENNTKVAFAQRDVNVVTCFHCCEKGCFARACPNKEINNKVHIHTQISNDLLVD